FEYYSESYIFPQWNPFILPVELQHEIMFSNHMNVIIKNNGSKTTWTGAMGITSGGGYFNSEACMLYPKEFVFDLNTHEFSFKDLYIEGANPDDNIPMCPWDLDEDGIVDSFSVTGDPLWVKNWPIYYPEGGGDNYFKTVQNENWMVSVWSDGTKAARFFHGDPSFAAWEETPEIAIIISADHGQTWSQPILLNANETPELADQIPCYIYPGDVIEILSNTPGDYRGKVHLFYLDDFLFGSQLTGTTNPGGNLMYTALDVEFPDAWIPGSSTENVEVPQPQITLYNYPNPFNPNTTIYFTAEDAEICIYNIKGQKVEQFVRNQLPSGQHSVVWDGRDESGELVSSGIYFYKLKAGNLEKTKKMILLK
ncbi:MAG: T9SS type A sorting domain-containing protein, partial [Armatimonadetes bacterium]|nr:T9SS type A sorting domain-containing protein [Armatimonadota bacterium]